MGPLDLYASVEPLIPFQEEIDALYAHYLQALEKVGAKTVLDIGCGGGRFMEQAKAAGFHIRGVDLSSAQVEAAQAKGLDARPLDLCTLQGETYDAAVAVFDVLNYLSPDQLGLFLSCVKKILKPGGFFFADANTLFGFREIAQGSIFLEGEELYANLDAVFEEPILSTKLHLFKRTGDLYRLEEGEIVQYYHTKSFLKKASALRLETAEPFHLYGDEPDKYFLTYRNI